MESRFLPVSQGPLPASPKTVSLPSSDPGSSLLVHLGIVASVSVAVGGCGDKVGSGQDLGTICPEFLLDFLYPRPIFLPEPEAVINKQTNIFLSVRYLVL